MNVVLVMERIETWRGGAEASTMAFAGQLSRLDCKVSILTTSNSPSTPDLTIIPIRANNTLRATKTWLFARRAASYIRGHDFDIVHSITPCLVADVYQPRGGTVPETLQRNLALREPALQRGFKRFGQWMSLKYRIMANLERRLLTRHTLPWVIAISQYVSDQLTRHYAFPSSRIRQIFNGIDPDLTPSNERASDRWQIRRQFGLADDALVLLCIAHNFKLKGVRRLIEAVARRRNKSRRQEDTSQLNDNTYVLIVGRDNPNPYVEIANRLKVADRILFSGPTQRIGAFFHAADILVHPTYYDPCSRVVLEGLAAGLPVITTRFNGAAERITDGREGFILDSADDVDALADRIDRLADPGRRREFAKRAPLAIENISIGRHAREVFDLYRGIIRDGFVKQGGYR